MTLPLTELLAVEDPVGVLTVTAGLDPRQMADGPTAPGEIRAGLDRAVEDADDPRAARRAVDRLRPRIDELLDPRAHGRGRLLVAGLGNGKLHEAHLQVALPTEVHLDDAPVLRRVLEVADEHRPAGVLLLHAQEALLLATELGEHEPVRSWAVELGDQVFGAEFYGPSPAVPGMSGRGATHREARADRVQANRDRFLDDVADDVRTLVEEHGWNRLVLVGPAHERDVVAKDLDGVSGLQVLQLKQVVGGAAHEVLDQVHRVISEAHREYEHDLVRRAVDAALSGGTGAVGPVDVARALTEGRVHHLLLSPDVDAAGLVDGDVLMAADDPRASGRLNDPRFVHRMIERALATDAAVTPVEGPAAELLDEHGELAALLRW